MPKIYLSPSTQDWNMYVTGSGSEEYNMNLLADALVPYLLSNGIQYRRNRPEMTAGSSVREANQGEYDLYLALRMCDLRVVDPGVAPEDGGLRLGSDGIFGVIPLRFHRMIPFSLILPGQFITFFPETP